MNLKEKLSLYKLELSNYSSIPSIAITAMEEWHESESLFICAWMTELDNSFELELYFKKALEELQIELSKAKDAFYSIALYYLNWVSKGEIDFIDWMHFIDDKLLDEWFFVFWKDTKYAHDATGLHSIRWGYIWYRDMEDYICKNELIWWRDPRNVQEDYKKWVLKDIEEYLKKHNK